MQLDDLWMLEPPLWQAAWGGRAEPVPQLASRVKETIDALTGVGGVLAHGWIVAADNEDEETLPTSPAGWASLVESHVSRDDAQKAFPQDGYDVSFFSARVEDPEHAYAVLSFTVGVAEGDPSRAVNRVSLKVRGRGDAVATYEYLAPRAAEILRIFASIWHPDTVEVTDGLLVDAHYDILQHADDWPRLGAITWFSNHAFRLAPDTAVPNAVLEPYGDGVVLYVGSSEDPAGDVASVVAVARELADRGLIQPPPVHQTVEPTVPQWAAPSPFPTD
jgi:hypothetical protein